MLLFYPHNSFSQKNNEFEETSVSLIVDEIGMVEIPALVQNNKTVYLPINYVFNFLKIKNTILPGADTVSGFFIKPENIFLIDNLSKSIFYEDKVVNLKPNDLVRTETNLYLKENYFGDIFELDCDFNFRSLSVELVTKIELPAIREMRLKKMRKNILRLAGKTIADTVIERDFKLFHFGMADWSINNINYLEHNTKSTRMNLALGGIVAGGETKVNLNYAFGEPLSDKHLTYFWRYANNNNEMLRQIRLGNIYTRSISTIFAPVVGVQLTNTPTTFRRSFGYHTISDYTKPGWIVELYMNNVLVDYVKADNSGFYTFEVPLIYGNTELNLRFYGPWGEELSSSQNLSIPYNFLPEQEFEYTTSAGMVKDSENSIFTRAKLNYGVNRYLTVGGGVEYLSSIESESQRIIPFLKTSLSLTSNLLFFGEYAAGVKSNAILSYRMPSNLQFKVNYTVFDKDQKAINTNRLEERKLTVSTPIRLGNFNLYSRFNLSQTIFPNTKYTNANLLFSGSIFGISTNFTANAIFYNSTESQLYSDLVFSFSLPNRFIIRPQMRYEYNRNEVDLLKVTLEKQLFDKLNINALVENNFFYDYFNVQVGVRYEFPFAQTSASVSSSNGNTTLYQSARGSLMYDGNTNYFEGNNRMSVGRSGIVILPYLDINGNNSRDKNEPKVNGLEVRINGGLVKANEQDTTIRIYNLEPYTNHFVELTSDGFEYIAWQIKKPTINVSINPNQFKLIEVPIEILGEVSGIVYLNKGEGNNGQGRMLVNIYKSDSTLVKRLATESDGYFNYLGLEGGSYFARIDSNQLNSLEMKSYPNEFPFEIISLHEGDFIDGLEFTVENERKEEKPKDKSEELIAIAEDSLDEEKKGEKSEQEILYLEKQSFNNVQFKFDSDKLTYKSKEILDKVINTLTLESNTKLEIQGHTDSVGPKHYNQKLSERRA
ncbi:MAG: OmpA family protein, partial [Ignavibacteriae bacterium]|nr:OmpA family protein [Ignavibacteriota bacterium]